MSSFYEEINQKTRTGLWAPIADKFPAFSNDIAQRFFGLPASAEADYIAVVLRCIEAAPDSVVKGFDPYALKEIPSQERLFLGRTAIESVRIFGFMPRELDTLYKSLLKHVLATESEIVTREGRIEYDAYLVCVERFLSFCTWLELSHQQDLALRTSSGDIASPQPVARRERPQLRLLKS